MHLLLLKIVLFQNICMILLIINHHGLCDEVDNKSDHCPIVLSLNKYLYIIIHIHCTHSPREAPYGAPQFEHHFPKSAIWRSLL